MAEKKKAVVLLSGGIDSTTALAVSIHSGFEPYAMSFIYGQRHAIEVEAALKARDDGSRADAKGFGGFVEKPVFGGHAAHPDG